MTLVIYGENTMADHAVRKYRGDVAKGYDAKREDSPKWRWEEEIITDMLQGVSSGGIVSGSWVLDVPCGTGRFFPFYAKWQYQVRAMDISADMMEEAKKKDAGLRYVQYIEGDVRNIPLADKSCDASVMCRLTRWLSPEDCGKAIRELARVTRQSIIFTARVHSHKEARPLRLFEVEGWRIHREEIMPGDDAYRIIEMRPE